MRREKTLRDADAARPLACRRSPPQDQLWPVTPAGRAPGLSVGRHTRSIPRGARDSCRRRGRGGMLALPGTVENRPKASGVRVSALLEDKKPRGQLGPRAPDEATRGLATTPTAAFGLDATRGSGGRGPASRFTRGVTGRRESGTGIRQLQRAPFHVWAASRLTAFQPITPRGTGLDGVWRGAKQAAPAAFLFKGSRRRVRCRGHGTTIPSSDRRNMLAGCRVCVRMVPQRGTTPGPIAPVGIVCSGFRYMDYGRTHPSLRHEGRHRGLVLHLSSPRPLEFVVAPGTWDSHFRSSWQLQNKLTAHSLQSSQTWLPGAVRMRALGEQG